MAAKDGDTGRPMVARGIAVAVADALQERAEAAELKAENLRMIVSRMATAFLCGKMTEVRCRQFLERANKIMPVSPLRKPCMKCFGEGHVGSPAQNFYQTCPECLGDGACRRVEKD